MLLSCYPFVKNDYMGAMRIYLEDELRSKPFSFFSNLLLHLSLMGFGLFLCSLDTCELCGILFGRLLR